MGTMIQDVKYALRMLAKSPGFTLIAVVTLALGIGANTAVFSMADAFLVRPISLPHVDRLAMISLFQKAPVSAADYLDWKKQSRSFEGMAAYREDDVNLTGAGVPERVFGSRVTSNFFSTLAVRPALGRAFLAEEEEAGRDQVAVLSYGLWQSRFAGNPDVLGQGIELDGKRYTVVGVTARDFDFPVPSDLWTPLQMDAAARNDRSTRNLYVIGRLGNGVSLAQAQSEMATIEERLAQNHPKADRDLRTNVMPVIAFVEGGITRQFTVIFLFAAAFVLLVACSNIASLQLARSTARQKEIAIRAALGASRPRIIRLLLIENISLALLGGAASLALASWVLGMLTTNMPADIARLIPGWYEIQVDHRALAFTLGVAILAGVLAGLIPAISASRAALNESLKEGGRTSAGSSRASRRLRGAFVTGQIAVALVLVTGAALMATGFRRLIATERPAAPEHVLTLAVNLPAVRYQATSARILFYRQVLTRLSEIPGVEQAATFSSIPLSNNGVTWGRFQIEGRAPAASPQDYPGAILQSVSPDYWSMLRIPLRQGRGFTDADRENAQPVAVISEKLAQLNWPKESALGKHLKVGNPESSAPWMTVVGVAGNVLYDWTDQTPEAVIYRPFAQAPAAESLFAVRTSGDPNQFAAPAQAALQGVDPFLPAFDVMPLSAAIHESLVGLDFTADMMAGLGVIALMIALVGVYGVMAYSVAERTHEFGLRMALGAQPSQIFWLACRRGAWLAGCGVAIGLPLAAALARVLQGSIFGARALDAGVFAGAALPLAAAALVACWIPARRALRVDPMVALRHE